jgi:Holliday junction DNA helicase RuvB
VAEFLPRLSEEERRFEETLRPLRFSEFIGQQNIVRNFKIAIEAAKKRKESLEHVLFTGPPGIGKTTLAKIIANEMRANFIFASGAILKKPADLAAILTRLEEGDVFFIDEIHRMQRSVEEYLYSAMEDFVISIVLQPGPYGRAINLPLKKFTLIGATTREGLLTDPLRSRFVYMEKLDFYPSEQIKKIIMRSARILRTKINDEAATLIASRSRGTPRIANRYLKRIRDLAQVKSNNVITPKIALEGLEMIGVDEKGLDVTDRKILKTLIEHKGGPVGLKTIATAVNEEEDTIEEVYEPYLIQQHFIKKTARGRIATEKALKYFSEKKDSGQKKLF